MMLDDPGASGTEDELTKKDIEQRRLLSLKAWLKNGKCGSVFELSFVDGVECWYCNLCSCPVLGKPYLHEIGKRHQNSMDRSKSRDAGSATEKDNSTVAEIPTEVIKTVEMNLAPDEPLPLGFEGQMQPDTEMQGTLDAYDKGPLLGLEYLLELQDKTGDESKYVCMLCDKKGVPRNVLSHVISYNHISAYMQIYFKSVHKKIARYSTKKYLRRNCMNALMRVAEEIEKRFGRLKPTAVDADTFEKNKLLYLEKITTGKHIQQSSRHTFREFVNEDELSKRHPDDSTSKPVEPPKPIEIKPPPKTSSDEKKEKKMSLSPNRSKESSKSIIKKNPKGSSQTKRSDSKRLPIPNKRQDSKRSSSTDRRRDSRRSLSPDRRRDARRSPSPDRRRDSRRSPSPNRRRDSRRSPSPSRRRDSRRSPSPNRRRDSRRSPSPSRRRDSRRSPSPNRRRDSRRSPSPSRRRDSRRSPSPNRRRDSRRSPSPSKRRDSGRALNIERRDSHPDRRNPNNMPWERSNYGQRKSIERDTKTNDKEDFMDRYKKLAKIIDDDMERSLKKYLKIPEKHPKYNEEWEKFWNRRFREVKLEGKDPTAYDFKPEWILFWTKRMKELHDDELRTRKEALGKRLGLPEGPAPIKFHIGAKQGEIETSQIPLPTAAQPDRNPDVINIDKRDSRSPSPERRKSRGTTVFGEEKSTDKRSSKERSSDRNFTRKRSRDRSSDQRSPDKKRERRMSTGSSSSESSVEGRHARRALSPGNKDVNIMSVLRILSAFEEKLGSLGPKVNDLLSQALTMDKDEPNGSMKLLNNNTNLVLFETVREKMKGLLMAGLVKRSREKAFNIAIDKTDDLVKLASNREHNTVKEDPSSVSSNERSAAEQIIANTVKEDPSSVSSNAAKQIIAKQVATSLVLRGKLDVSQSELDQIVGVVVRMTEGSRRSGEPMPASHYIEQVCEMVAPKKDALRSNDGHSKTHILSDTELQIALQTIENLSKADQENILEQLKEIETKDPARAQRLKKFLNLEIDSYKIRDTRMENDKEISMVLSDGNDNDKRRSRFYQPKANYQNQKRAYDNAMKEVWKKLEENEIEKERKLAEDKKRNVKQTASEMQNKISDFINQFATTKQNVPPPSLMQQNTNRSPFIPEPPLLSTPPASPRLSSPLINTSSPPPPITNFASSTPLIKQPPPMTNSGQKVPLLKNPPSLRESDIPPAPAPPSLSSKKSPPKSISKPGARTASSTLTSSSPDNRQRSKERSSDRNFTRKRSRDRSSDQRSPDKKRERRMSTGSSSSKSPLERRHARRAHSPGNKDVNNMSVHRTVREKMKALFMAGLVERSQEKAFNIAIDKTDDLVEKSAAKQIIAKQVAISLVLRGKLNVSQSELDQIVGVVVGMIEGSRRSGEPMPASHYIEQVCEMVAPKKDAVKSNDGHSKTHILSDTELQIALQTIKNFPKADQENILEQLKEIETKDPARAQRLKKFLNWEIDSYKIRDTRMENNKEISMVLSDGNDTDKLRSRFYQPKANYRNQKRAFDNAMKEVWKKLEENEIEKERKLAEDKKRNVKQTASEMQNKIPDFINQFATTKQNVPPPSLMQQNTNRSSFISEPPLLSTPPATPRLSAPLINTSSPPPPITNFASSTPLIKQPPPMTNLRQKVPLLKNPPSLRDCDIPPAPPPPSLSSKKSPPKTISKRGARTASSTLTSSSPDNRQNRDGRFSDRNRNSSSRQRSPSDERDGGTLKFEPPVGSDGDRPNPFDRPVLERLALLNRLNTAVAPALGGLAGIGGLGAPPLGGVGLVDRPSLFSNFSSGGPFVPVLQNSLLSNFSQGLNARLNPTAGIPPLMPDKQKYIDYYI